MSHEDIAYLDQEIADLAELPGSKGLSEAEFWYYTEEYLKVLMGKERP